MTGLASRAFAAIFRHGRRSPQGPREGWNLLRRRRRPRAAPRRAPRGRCHDGARTVDRGVSSARPRGAGGVGHARVHRSPHALRRRDRGPPRSRRVGSSWRDDVHHRQLRSLDGRGRSGRSRRHVLPRRRDPALDREAAARAHEGLGRAPALLRAPRRSPSQAERRSAPRTLGHSRERDGPPASAHPGGAPDRGRARAHGTAARGGARRRLSGALHQHAHVGQDGWRRRGFAEPANPECLRVVVGVPAAHQDPPKAGRHSAGRPQREHQGQRRSSTSSRSE